MKAALLALCGVLLMGLWGCQAASPAPDATPIAPAVTAPELYENLIAWVETEAEAQAIAEAYGITLCDYQLNIASYHTDEDPTQVIRRGIEEGLPELSLNGTIQPFPDS